MKISSILEKMWIGSISLALCKMVNSFLTWTGHVSQNDRMRTLLPVLILFFICLFLVGWITEFLVKKEVFKPADKNND